jgi:NitT/TauT family transport system substrate-binding protein
MISEDKHNAAEVLLESMGGGKGWNVDEFVAILNDPATKYTTKPENVLKYANFMHEIGSIRNRPNSLSDLFFDPTEVGGGN